MKIKTDSMKLESAIVLPCLVLGLSKFAMLPMQGLGQSVQPIISYNYGAGNAKALILVVVMRKFILLIPIIYIMSHIFTADKARVIYMADFFAVCFIAVLFYFQFKKALCKMGREQTV